MLLSNILHLIQLCSRNKNDCRAKFGLVLELGIGLVIRIDVGFLEEVPNGLDVIILLHLIQLCSS